MVPSGGDHAGDASTVPATGPYDQDRETPANSGLARLPAWDWSFDTDGGLALEPEPRAVPPPEHHPLSGQGRSVTVPRMAWPQAPGLATRAALREHERAKVRRARRLAALVILAFVAVVTLLLTAFGTGGSTLVPTTGPAPAGRLLPSGPPKPQVVAMHDTLRIQLPIDQARVTAIGYHAAGTGALALEPVGEQANAGVFGRLAHRLFGDGGSGLRYYLLEGGVGPATGGLDIGAPVDTDVYAPVDGTVLAISDQVLNGKRYGVRIDIQPAGNPGVVVAVSNLRPDPALTVGSTVSAARTKIGRVVDLSAVEHAGLASYTQDKGQHVHLEAHAAASLAAP